MPFFSSISTVALLAAFAVGAPAATDPPSGSLRPAGLGAGPHPLSEVVAWAVRHSDAVAAALARAEAARFAARQALAWPNPSAGVFGGPDARGGRVLFTVSANQPLPLAGKSRLRSRAAELESERWEARRRAAEIAAASEVVKLAYLYESHRRRARYAVVRQERFTLVRTYLSGRVLASPQRRTEARIVEQRLRHYAADTIRNQASVRAVGARIQQFARFERDPEIAVPWLSGAGAGDEDGWIASSLANSPEMADGRIAVRSAEVERDLASREAWADPSLTGSYANLDPRIGLGLSVPLPLWTRNGSGIVSAEKNAAAAARELDLRRIVVESRTRTALAECEAGRLVAAQFPAGLIAGLERQLHEVESEFRKGRVDLLTFLELDDELADTHARALEAQRSLADSTADLIAVSGSADFVAQLARFQEASR